MAEEEETTYTLTVTTEAEGTKTLKSSHGFTGKGTAVYPNQEIFEGDYVGGVIDKMKLLLSLSR